MKGTRDVSNDPNQKAAMHVLQSLSPTTFQSKSHSINQKKRKLTISAAEGLQGLLVTKGVFAGLDDELKAGVDALLSLVLYTQTNG